MGQPVLNHEFLKKMIFLDSYIPIKFHFNTVFWKIEYLKASVFVTFPAAQVLYGWLVCAIRLEKYCGAPVVLIS